jgi:hypothetical protein
MFGVSALASLVVDVFEASEQEKKKREAENNKLKTVLLLFIL